MVLKTIINPFALNVWNYLLLFASFFPRNVFPNVLAQQCLNIATAVCILHLKNANASPKYLNGRKISWSWGKEKNCISLWRILTCTCSAQTLFSRIGQGLDLFRAGVLKRCIVIPWSISRHHWVTLAVHTGSVWDATNSDMRLAPGGWIPMSRFLFAWPEPFNLGLQHPAHFLN